LAEADAAVIAARLPKARPTKKTIEKTIAGYLRP
jgi:hypothetical protein